MPLQATSHPEPEVQLLSPPMCDRFAGLVPVRARASLACRLQVEFRRHKVEGRAGVTDAAARQLPGLSRRAEAGSDHVMSVVKVPASALIRRAHERLLDPTERRRSRAWSPQSAHATDRLSHRRQVAVASVTRRSQWGQSADISSLASDQTANLEAGIGPRQYTHGTLDRS
jgi:hypothetical protein